MRMGRGVAKNLATKNRFILITSFATSLKDFRLVQVQVELHGEDRTKGEPEHKTIVL